MTLSAHMHFYSYMYCAPHRDGVLHEYCIGSATFLGLASGPSSPFFKPYQLPFSPCVRNAWARAVTLFVSVAISICLFEAGLARALSPSYVL